MGRASSGTDLEAYYAEYGGMVVSATIDKYFYVFLRNDITFPPDHFAVPPGDCLQVHRLDV